MVCPHYCENIYVECNNEQVICSSGLLQCLDDKMACDNEFVLCNNETISCDDPTFQCHDHYPHCDNYYVLCNGQNPCSFTAENGTSI